MQASIVKVKALNPIQGADAIEAASVLGWTVVVRKSEFKAGDYAIYIALDSIVPKDRPWCAFMEKSSWRVKTIKLRGQLSQGLLVPWNALSTEEQQGILVLNQGYLQEGIDVTSVLGVEKYEKPIPMGSEAKGNFPPGIPKTDEERIQNLWDVYSPIILGSRWSVTEKLNGTSCTVCVTPDGVPAVCSRNLSLKEFSQDGAPNKYWVSAREQGLIAAVEANPHLALQGELCGPGIQGNPYNLPVPTIFLFKIFGTDSAKYLDPDSFFSFCQSNGLLHVPHLDEKDYNLSGISALEQLVSMADGVSALHNCGREGLVFQHHPDPSSPPCNLTSFKVISNKYLLKHGE